MVVINGSISVSDGVEKQRGDDVGGDEGFVCLNTMKMTMVVDDW